jgi:hypothetical protein
MLSKLGISDLECGTTNVLASSYMAKADAEKIFLRVTAAEKEAWEAMCESQQINQTKAGAALARWIIGQTPEVRAMIFGQIPAAPDVVEVILKRMAKRFRVVQTPPPVRPGATGTPDTGGPREAGPGDQPRERRH